MSRAQFAVVRVDRYNGQAETMSVEDTEGAAVIEAKRLGSNASDTVYAVVEYEEIDI